MHILMVGYNGARNTGADVRVAEIVKQLQQSKGKIKRQLVSCQNTLDGRLFDFMAAFS